jgi:guanyl-specific ribonuclease Sa
VGLESAGKLSVKVIEPDSTRSVRRMIALLGALALGLGCGRPSRAERAVLAADAEVFEAVIRSELSPDPADSAASLRVMRVDSRPVTDNGELTASSTRHSGFELDKDSDSVSDAGVTRIADQRKEILSDLHVEEGGPFAYPGCGGSRSHGSTEQSIAACPRDWRRYITVGIPYRGTAAVIDKLRTQSPRPDSSAELWTVLVAENSVGPGGQEWRQYAWLLRRDPVNGQLALVEKFLLSWAE